MLHYANLNNGTGLRRVIELTALSAPYSSALFHLLASQTSGVGAPRADCSRGELQLGPMPRLDGEQRVASSGPPAGLF